MSLVTLFSQQKTAQTGIFTDATLPTTRLVDGEPVLDPSGDTVAISGSFTALRGNLTIDSADTVTAGYLYGVQGKLTNKGTLNLTHSEYCAALVGQFDFSSAVAVTSVGGLSMLWLDAGASATPAIFANANAINITNTTGAALANILWVDANAASFGNLQDRGGGFVHSSSGKTFQNMGLLVTVNGTAYQIPLYNV